MVFAGAFSVLVTVCLWVTVSFSLVVELVLLLVLVLMVVAGGAAATAVVVGLTVLGLLVFF